MLDNNDVLIAVKEKLESMPLKEREEYLRNMGFAFEKCSKDEAISSVDKRAEYLSARFRIIHGMLCSIVAVIIPLLCQLFSVYCIGSVDIALGDILPVYLITFVVIIVNLVFEIEKLNMRALDYLLLTFATVYPFFSEKSQLTIPLSIVPDGTNTSVVLVGTSFVFIVAIVLVAVLRMINKKRLFSSSGLDL